MGDAPLISHATSQVSSADIIKSVWDYTDGRGGWKWEELSNLLPPAIILKIRAIPSFPEADYPDTMILRGSTNGKFSTKSAYALLDDLPPNGEEDKWRVLWKMKGLPKTKYFLWLARQDRLLTNKVRITRQITTDGRCHACSFDMEDGLHVLRDCPAARDICLALIPPEHHQQFFSLSLSDWIDFNLNGDMNGTYEISSWQILFGQTTWALWTWRNKAIFDPNFVKPNNPIELILMKAREIEDCLRLESCSPFKQQRLISWTFPPTGWVKLNTDGSVKGSSGEAAGGGLIRDETGRWMVRFGVNIGICTVTVAELWALFHGLSLT